jgi:hypothetical protein
MEINKEIMDRASKILSKKDDITSKLALASNKVKELSDQLEILEPQIIESFGSSDINVLEGKLEELTKEVEALLDQINKG